MRNSIILSFGGVSVGESVASSAVKTAIDIGAQLIVVMSERGKMANYVAKFRPGVRTLMLTPDLVAARQASGLLLGVHTIQVDSLENPEELIEEVNYELIGSDMMNEGEQIVVIGGRMAGADMRERLRVYTLGKGKSYGRFVKGGGLFFNRGMILSFSTD